MASTTAKIILSDKQLQWLDKHFKNTKNIDVAKHLGISESTMHRIARSRGLVKTKQFMKKCQRETAAAADLSHRINGTYPPKGFLIPNRHVGEFKKGVSIADRLGRKRAGEIHRRAIEKRQETLHKEKSRVVFGLPQKTKLHVVRQSRAHTSLRYALKKHDYIVDDENGIAYYDEQTNRSKRIENRQQSWYRFEQL